MASKAKQLALTLCRKCFFLLFGKFKLLWCSFHINNLSYPCQHKTFIRPMNTLLIFHLLSSCACINISKVWVPFWDVQCPVRYLSRCQRMCYTLWYHHPSCSFRVGHYTTASSLGQLHRHTSQIYITTFTIFWSSDRGHTGHSFSNDVIWHAFPIQDYCTLFNEPWRVRGLFPGSLAALVLWTA